MPSTKGAASSHDFTIIPAVESLIRIYVVITPGGLVSTETLRCQAESRREWTRESVRFFALLRAPWTPLSHSVGDHPAIKTAAPTADGEKLQVVSGNVHAGPGSPLGRTDQPLGVLLAG